MSILKQYFIRQVIRIRTSPSYDKTIYTQMFEFHAINICYCISVYLTRSPSYLNYIVADIYRSTAVHLYVL